MEAACLDGLSNDLHEWLSGGVSGRLTQFSF